MSDELLIAVFVDFENLALGVRDVKGGRLKIDLVIKRLLEKGRIVYKRAYCDWSGYRDDVRDFHMNGVELVDIPRRRRQFSHSSVITNTSCRVTFRCDLCNELRSPNCSPRLQPGIASAGTVFEELTCTKCASVLCLDSSGHASRNIEQFDFRRFCLHLICEIRVL